MWVVVGEEPNGYAIATSPNGKDWTPVSSYGLTSARAVAYSAPLNLWIAAGAATAISSDCVTWNSTITPFNYLGALQMSWSEQLGLFAAVARESCSQLAVFDPARTAIGYPIDPSLSTYGSTGISSGMCDRQLFEGV